MVDAFFARTGKMIGEVGMDKRAENAAERRDYPALERGHDGAARAQTWPSLNALGRLQVALVTDGLNEQGKASLGYFFRFWRSTCMFSGRTSG